MKKIRLPGDHLNLYRIVKIFAANLEKDEIMDRANGVAYYFVLAIFATIIFLFTLIPYISQYFPAIDQASASSAPCTPTAPKPTVCAT